MKQILMMIAAVSLLTGCVIAIDADDHDDGIDVSYAGQRGKPAYLKTRSTLSYPATVAALEDAIETRGLTTFTVIDHGAGASSVGQSLEPTVVYIFGNPRGGIPLIREEREMGLNLPLRAMVWQDGNDVMVATTNILRLADQYDLDNEEIPGNMHRMLGDIRMEAAGR